MKHLLFAFFVLVPFICSAQIYRHIGTQNGLGDHKIYRVLKDSLGYMWFLTNEGIDRYNGKFVKHYRLMDGTTAINPRMNLNWLYLDNKHILWVIGRKGRIFRYDKMHDCFVKEYSFPKLAGDTPTDIISYGHMDRNNFIWLCDNDCITIFNPSIGQTVQVIPNKYGTINAIEQADSTNYFLGTEEGLYCISMKEGVLLPQSCKRIEPVNARISELFYHSASHKLFIGTFHKGVYVYNLSNPSDIRCDNISGSASITRITDFSDEEVLVATNCKGVFKMGVDSCKMESYITANYESYNELNVNNINDIFVDDGKCIWLVNYPGGITIRDNRYTDYRWIKHSIGNPQSLINNQVNDIIEDSDGDLWFGTNNGVSLYSYRTRRWHTFLNSSDNEQDDSNIIMILCEVSPDVVWVGGYTSGIYQINKRTMTVEYISPSLCSLSGSTPDHNIKDIKVDSQGCIWSGGCNSLKCFNPRTRKARIYSGLSSVTSIIEKNAGHMWIGTSMGLYLLNKESGFYELLDFPAEMMNVCVLCQTDDNKLYIGTDGAGLIVYDIPKKTFVRYNTDNCALISNNIYTIIPRADGSMLMSTENGIVIFSPHDKSILNWTREQGLMSASFNAGSCVLTKKGRCILGSNDGVISFPANLQIPHRRYSPMIFSDFLISYQSVYPGDDNSPLEKDINETQHLKLKYNQNTFSFQVSSINYDYPSNILYSWKLNGFYNEWNTPNSEGLVRFTNLPPGEYVLDVRSVSNEDKTKVLEDRKILITVARPAWASAWAILAYILLFLLISGVVIRMILLRKQKKIADERTQFFTTTAHEIRTPLTLIKAPLEELLTNKLVTTEGVNHLNMALKNVHTLLRLTSNLINLAHINIDSSELYISEHELNAFIQEICHSFMTFAEARHIHLNCECHFNYLNVWFDKDKMDSIVKNLLSNAIKYTPENGCVYVCVDESAETWSVEIRDTGIGIPDSEQKKMFRSFFRASNAVNSRVAGSGVGLMLVHKLVRLHKGKIMVNSILQEGTSIKIIFPKGNKHFRKAHLISRLRTDVIAQIPQMQLYATTKRDERIEGERFLHRILIVEDHDDLRVYLVDMLSKDYKVQECCNGKEALPLLDTFRPELVLSDIMMPEMGGDELCNAIKSNIETSHIPVVLLTALNDEKNILQGLKNGADDYIVKPFTIEILKASIENILLNRALLRRRYGDLELQEEIGLDSPMSELDRKFLLLVREIIEKNISNSDFNVDMLCASLNMCRTNLYNKLKELTDHSPSEYIRFIRLHRAAQLLEQGKNNVTEVAWMCGFNNVKYFREVFKKHFNVCPSKHGKAHKRE
ncbi:response regulator [uncultured Bacteroides sp.]|uniref:hybrid sensor histidine kinase/response regulator transcription factor n=1 Tax=uncultured Bacteroides sp. TaxID=162156 RepID=UPI0025CCED5F|nr:response regulator [uncultured Bacteroides sp.]